MEGYEERLNKLENKNLKEDFNMFDSAIDDIVKFMEGKSDYKMCHFRKV